MNLSKNAITQILKGAKDASYFPILQITELSKLRSGIRLHLSDGHHYTQCINMSSKIKEEIIDQLKFQIVKLIKYSIAVIKCIKCIFVEDLEFLFNPFELIGSPEPIEVVEDTPATPKNILYNINESPMVKPQQNEVPESDDFYAPIRALSTTSSDWTIKVRVTHKSKIRTWSKPRSEGKLFNCVLVDSMNDEIQATFFNQFVDLYFERIAEGKVYTISGGNIKRSNPNFSMTENDIEISCEKGTLINEVADDPRIPKVKFNFIPLDLIPKSGINRMVDVSGFIVDLSEPAKMTSKKGEEFTKRSLVITDHTGYSIEVTLWSDLALLPLFDDLDVAEKPLICFKSLKITDFNSISLSSDRNSTQISLNPPENDHIKFLKNWKAGQKNIYPSTPLSERKHRNIALKTAFEIKEEWSNLLITNKTEIFRIIGIVGKISISDDRPPWYESCGYLNCKKKVNRDTGGFYVCDTCNKSSETCVYRYMYNLSISDCTSDLYATAFDEVMSDLLKMPAGTLHELYINSVDKADEVLAGVFGRYVNLIIRAEAADNKAKHKFTIKKLEPFNASEVAQMLMNEIIQITN